MNFEERLAQTVPSLKSLKLRLMNPLNPLKAAYEVDKKDAMIRQG